MGKPKKHSVAAKPAPPRDEDEDDADELVPPPRPPATNLPMLIVSIGLVVFWLGALVVIALVT